VKGVRHLDIVLNLHIIVHPLATDVIDVHVHRIGMINLQITMFDTLRRPIVCLLRLADKHPLFVEIVALAIMKDVNLNLRPDVIDL
jgi:hypothetical protein